MSDLISRQAAINAPVRMVSEGIEWIPVYHVEQLPSVQPQRKPGKTLAEEVERIKRELTDIFTEQMGAQPETHDKRTETHACDLIDRQAAIDAMEGLPKYFDTTDTLCLDYADVLAVLSEHLPSAQPQRMKGRWIDVTKTGGAELWKCSECGELELEDSYYCPNCGADMRGEQDD